MFVGILKNIFFKKVAGDNAKTFPEKEFIQVFSKEHFPKVSLAVIVKNYFFKLKKRHLVSCSITKIIYSIEDVFLRIS